MMGVVKVVVVGVDARCERSVRFLMGHFDLSYCTMKSASQKMRAIILWMIMIPMRHLGHHNTPGDEISKGKADGRNIEIQRLIGRSLRAVIDLQKLGQNTLWLDCDVLQADGGTRTAAITGASLAVELAGRWLVEQGKIKELPVKNRVAAVSVGIVAGEVLVDLDYLEDKDAEVDMNVVMTDKLDYVEVQGSGEESVFSASQLEQLTSAAKSGIEQLLAIQKSALE